MKTARAVAKAFLARIPRGGGNIFTTGDEVFSYDMVIAQWLPCGRLEVISTGPSATTKRHINAVWSEAVSAGLSFDYTSRLTGRAAHVFRRQSGRGYQSANHERNP